MMLAFNGKYFLLAVCLFAVEVIIAVFIKDLIVRPFIGDVLVVVLIYCVFRSFFQANHLKPAIGVLLFACLIEILQYFDYVVVLHLENNRVLSVMLGRTFEWMDFVAYFTGFLIIVLAESFLEQDKAI